MLFRSLKGNGRRLQTGYKGIIEIGYEIGTSDFNTDRLKLNIINGYQINPYFSAGFGTGLRYYFDAKAALIPVFADFRANFIDDNVSPYLSLSVGYSFDATNSFKDVGFLLNPTVGVSFMISEKSAMNIGLGYEIQKMTFYEFWDGAAIGTAINYATYSDNSGAISINVGISF